MSNLTPAHFASLISAITGCIEDKVLDGNLQAELEATFPPDGETFTKVFEACRQGVVEGWMCAREAGGIKFGRAIKPGPETHAFSVDVVEMENVEGPHHLHPNGEIDMVMPLTPGARFDGHGAGWVVYGPGSAHSPTVSEGKALILYLLPGGAIEFSKP